jgi:type II secretion system protein G
MGKLPVLVVFTAGLLSWVLSPEPLFGDTGRLLQRYKPVVYISDKDEKPVSFDFLLSHSTLKKDIDWGIDRKIGQVGVNTIGRYNSEEYYLDIDVRRATSTPATPTIYGRAVRRSGKIYLQYYFLYARSTLPSRIETWHEGDVEMMQVVLDPKGNPESVDLSQHYYGASRNWADVEKEGNRPMVCVAKGSHALQFEPGVYVTRFKAKERYVVAPALDAACDHKAFGKWQRVEVRLIAPPEDSMVFAWKGRLGARGLGAWGHAPQMPKYRTPGGGKLVLWDHPDKFHDFAGKFEELRLSGKKSTLPVRGVPAGNKEAEVRIAARVRADLKVIEDSIEFFKLDTQQYPKHLNELVEGAAIDGWRGPYLRRPPIDPWGRPYEYKYTGGQPLPYEIRTLGADGRVGGYRKNKDYSNLDYLQRRR